MKKVLYLLLSLAIPLSYAMENTVQRHPNEIDCWQKHGLKTLYNEEISCRSSARETDAIVVIEQTNDAGQKKQHGISHQTYRILHDAINNAKLSSAVEYAQLHQELRSIVSRLPYSEVVFQGLTQAIKDKLNAGDFRVILPGFIEQDYPQFFADKDHSKMANGFLNGIKFQDRMNAALAEMNAFEQKINALPKKLESSSDWLKPHILIPAGILVVAIVGLLLWEKLFKKQAATSDEQKKKPAKKRVRFDETKNVIYPLSSQ